MGVRESSKETTGAAGVGFLETVVLVAFVGVGFEAIVLAAGLGFALDSLAGVVWVVAFEALAFLGAELGSAGTTWRLPKGPVEKERLRLKWVP